jgi:hypothetical protein
MFSILKLKRAKNSYGGYPTDFFNEIDKNFKLPSKIFENIPEYTKENKIRSKSILMCTVLNKKAQLDFTNPSWVCYTTNLSLLCVFGLLLG